MAVKNMFVPAPRVNCQQDCAEYLLQDDDFALVSLHSGSAEVSNADLISINVDFEC